MTAETFTATRGGVTESFAEGADFYGTPRRDLGRDYHWTIAGAAKLVKLGLWAPQYSAFGKLKNPAPTVEQIKERGAAQATRANLLAAAAQPDPKPIATAPTPIAAPPKLPAAAAPVVVHSIAASKIPSANMALSPDEVAARVNGVKPTIGNGWDDVIAKLNAEKARGNPNAHRR
jgi:hypothetical protein